MLAVGPDADGPPAALLPAAGEHVVDLLGGRLQHAARLALRATLGDPLHEPGQVLSALLVEVEAVGGLGEPQVGVDAGDHDPGVDRQDLDPHEGDPDEDVDDQALVEDERDDVGEAARTAARGTFDVSAATATTALCRDGHRSSPPARTRRRRLVRALVLVRLVLVGLFGLGVLVALVRVLVLASSGSSSS